MKKINKVVLCSNMSGFFPDTIKILQEKGIEISEIFLMKKNYYLKNKKFFDKMITSGLGCDLENYLKSTEYKVSLIDNINNPHVIKKIDQINPDLIINNAMMYIYGSDIIKRYKILNTHSGHLPFYRGRCGASWAIYNGARKHGISCHLIDEGVDTGPILAQAEIEIKKNNYVYDILMEEKRLFPVLIRESIEKLDDEKFAPKIQHADEGTHFPVLNSDVDGIIDWQSENTEKIYNKIRAFSFPYAGAFTLKEGVKYVIARAHIPEDNMFICSEPGLVFGKEKSGSIKVTTIDGYIIIQRIIVGDEEASPDKYWKIGEYLYTNPLKEHVKKLQKK